MNLENIDWTGVPANLLPEVKRRVAILEAFIDLTRPTRADRMAAITQLGVGRAMFYRILAQWKRTRNPAELPGARLAQRSPRGRRLLDEAVDEIISEVLERLGSEAKAETLVAAIRDRCGAASLRPPSRMTIRQRRRAAVFKADASGGAVPNHERAS